MFACELQYSPTMSFTPINKKPTPPSKHAMPLTSPRNPNPKRKNETKSLPPLIPFSDYKTPIRTYVCIHSATSIKETMLRSIHAQNRNVSAILEPQLNNTGYTWSEWSKYDSLHLYQEIYGPGTAFILFSAQDPAVKSSVGAFVPQKDVLMRCMEKLLSGEMVETGRTLERRSEGGEAVDWFEMAWKESKVIRWIILPKSLSTVPLLALNTHWDLLILLPGTSALPTSVTSQLAAEWHVTVGVPSRVLKDFPAKNSNLLNPPPGSVRVAARPDQTEASSTQNLELTPELASWIHSLPPAQRNHPVSMLNLLSFVPGMKQEYLKYGAAFAKSIGSRHGGDAKIVGNVIHQDNGRAKANTAASANGAAAAGYMIPGQAVDKSSGKNGSAGASASGPDASGLMVEDETTRSSPSKASTAKEGASASGAPAAGYMIPDEAQNHKTTSKRHATGDAKEKISDSEAHKAAYKITDEAQNASNQGRSTSIPSAPAAAAAAAGYMIPTPPQPNQRTQTGASASGAPSSGLMIETEPPSSIPPQDAAAKWDEIAIAHYPSLLHFAAMAGSRDYQSVNHAHRIPSLRDTFILCTMEIGDDGELAGGRGRGDAKL
ncbi:hypothetical protein FKW77_010122 [Venturia effusa]|uniref:Uncharacterized protein n=1 Tax=Venturia effusa TaxID=50376 RepID=A0A517L288_9PEZI|nr:hypothetical protein FKW77_010122 [Venturia effusa]